jgi:hypothetical protein
VDKPRRRAVVIESRNDRAAKLPKTETLSNDSDDVCSPYPADRAPAEPCLRGCRVDGNSAGALAHASIAVAARTELGRTLSERPRHPERSLQWRGGTLSKRPRHPKRSMRRRGGTLSKRPYHPERSLLQRRLERNPDRSVHERGSGRVPVRSGEVTGEDHRFLVVGSLPNRIRSGSHLRMRGHGDDVSQSVDPSTRLHSATSF